MNTNIIFFMKTKKIDIWLYKLVKELSILIHQIRTRIYLWNIKYTIKIHITSDPVKKTL